MTAASAKAFEIVFSRKCYPPTKIVEADRYEIRTNVITGEKEIVFICDEYDSVITRESVDYVKAVREVQP